MKPLAALPLARAAGRLALSKKGFDVRVLKLKQISSVCDYFVIASGEADVHARAIAEGIIDGLKKQGTPPTHVEGLTEGNWVLIDYIDVVVHIFYEPTRRFYALEKLWGDAPAEELHDSEFAQESIRPSVSM